ncbi:MAG: PleD family two-component system response regulator [Alphaproteobacteria bacterium]|nr:PleD family two-component system response regulator [Alphaproteobacteria bacterium]MBP9877886.1 PleD family two-component system response regulator [Alphaproteobacteria bacterium]
MSARILVVDDVKANVKLLEVKLLREYFSVITAMDGAEALSKIESESPDIVLLDVMMPGMDGFQVCQKIRANPKTDHIPVIMITALSEPEDRVKGLEAGADDFLTKPINDVALLARVKSLVRLKILIDEFKTRAITSEDLGVVSGSQKDVVQTYQNARILLLNDMSYDAERLTKILQKDHHVVIHHQKILSFDENIVKGDFDLAIIDLNLSTQDGLRIVSEIRNHEKTRNLPILLIGEEADFERVLKGLEIGALDYVLRPIDDSELLARARTQIKRKRYQERLKQSYHDSLNLALTDSLTGVYNRRYVDAHLPKLIAKALQENKHLSVLMFDIDHFKKINDTYGHIVGDEILKQVTSRVNGIVRGSDFLARLGGEEFLVVLPDTDLKTSSGIGERLLTVVSENQFDVKELTVPIPVTISVGMAHIDAEQCATMSCLLKNADDALYKAKENGRNRLIDHDKTAAA